MSIPDSVIITQPVPIKNKNYKDNCAFYYSQKSYFGGYQSVIMTGGTTVVMISFSASYRVV